MKMRPETYKDLKAAIARTGMTAKRARWDALWASGFDVARLYKEGLNDEHIDTALRSIVTEGEGKMERTTKIDMSQVASVYSGVNGRCCCGCAGKHTYASAHRDWASKNRGYAVASDEVNDRTVKLIVGKMQKLEPLPDGGDEYVAAVSGDRLYIAYLRKE